MVPTNINHIKVLSTTTATSPEIQKPSLRITEEPWCGKHLNEQEVPLKNVYNYANKKDTNDKTPMCRVAELARYNKLKHEYILLDEDGPAHKKLFKVKLVLCDGEEFEGSGPSIKKAQQSAAEVAMEKSKLPRAPTKSKKQRKDSSNPTMLLNHVANQLGITVHYEDDIQQIKPKGRFPIPQQSQQRQQQQLQQQQQQQLRVSQEVRNVPFMPPPPYPLLRFPPPPYPPQGFFPTTFSPTTRCHLPPFQMMPPPTLSPSQMSAPRSLLSKDFIMSLPPPSLTSTAMNNGIKTTYKSKIKLSDGSEHCGEGSNKFDARCFAATKALTHLKPQLTELEAKMSKLKTKSAELSNSSNSSESSTTSSIDDNKENDNDGDGDVEVADVNDNTTTTMTTNGRKNRQKSVVSQIHEYALRLKMNVEFEVIQESGEPHKRKYVLRCQLSATGKEPIVADGEGTSKKSAKQEACKKMLETLQGIETDPLYLASMILLTNKKTAASLAPKEPKRKTIIKDLKMDPQYGHHINPISRLIQVMQSKKEPTFRLIKEQGQNRYKEFTFEITCRGITLTGAGPNKKLAKRAAAEAMLEQIGYVKPMPQPGKSLLKKKSIDSATSSSGMYNTSIDIGIFDPTELVAVPETAVTSSSSPPPPSATTAAAASEVTTPILSPRPSMNGLETFADVDNSLKDSSEASNDNNIINDGTPEIPKSPQRVTMSPIDDKEDSFQVEQIRKRRVTFSNQVSACPPPEDSNYPESSIAPLKSEVVIVSKLKKRGKDSKKSLTPEEKAAVAELCRDFFAYPLSENERKGYVSRDNDGGQFQIPTPENNQWQGPAIKTAKERLESLATSFKFTVAYSDFPKTETDSNDSQYFSLVSLGLEKPIVCHGSGNTNELAHNDAAFNALKDLTMIDGGIIISLPSQHQIMHQQQPQQQTLLTTLVLPHGIPPPPQLQQQQQPPQSSTSMNLIPPPSSGVLPVDLSLIQ
uniref:DRBM domain-containing protein n=1 Tax=Panagrolaimus superbus TaxID=310955 RepID=A0A914Z9N7_9BILA